jgi:MFS family permease
MATTDSDMAPTTGTRPSGAASGVGATPATANRNAAIITLVIICAAVFLTALDQLVVATALVPIASSFQLDFTKDTPSISWIISGYLLGYVIVMPLMGRVSDLWGRRRVLIGCLLLFALGSFICAESFDLSGIFDLGFLSAVGIHSPSPALSWLIIARFIQAVGGGAVVPIAIAAIGDLFGDRRRILALGLIGGVTEAGGALGPLYGALIIQKWGFLPGGFSLTLNDTPYQLGNYSQPWQWIFLLNLPLVAIIILALIILWPRQTSAGATTTTRRHIDLIGAALLGGSLVCASLGLSQEAGAVTTLSQAHAAQNNPLLIGAAVVLLVLFVVVESIRRDPLINLAVFRSRAFSAGSIFSFLLGMALVIALIDIPFFVLAVFGTDRVLDAGLALLRMTVMVPIGAFGGGWLVTRFGTRIVGAVGAAFTALGFGLMHFWTVHTGWGEITISAIITGIGFGLIVAPISSTALNATATQFFGVAASVVTALRMIGMMLGLAILTSWGVGRYEELTRSIPSGEVVSDPQAYASAITAVTVHVITDFFTAGFVVSLLALIPAFFLWKPKPEEAQEAKEITVLPLA